MNIVLTRTKEEHLNVWWEPFATSTPLKAVPNAKITSVPQSQPLIHSNSADFVDKIRNSCRVADVFQKESKPLISKKARKKKSSSYFDLTSSSDEDSSDGTKKRPIIKLRRGKKTKSILVNKNLSNENISRNKEINNGKELENMSVKNCQTDTVLSVRNLQFENVQSHEVKGRIINDALRLGSNSKNTSVSSDDGSKIFDETRKVKNISKESNSHLVNKENKTCNSKSGDNLKYLKVSEDVGKTILKGTRIINPVFKKSVYKNIGQDSESLSIPQNRTSEYNKSFKSKKRKCKDNEIRINSVKTTKNKKISNKLTSHIPVENSGSLLHIWEYKNNLSHQLFSDSREQELINILDLTSEELDEKVKNMESSLIQKKRKLCHKSTNSSHPSVNNELDVNECRQNQPKRKKQNWKRCLMLENPSDELVQNVNTKSKIQLKKNSNSKLTNNEQILEFQMQKHSEELGLFSDGVKPENSLKSDKKSLRTQKNSKKKSTSAPKKSKTSFAVNDFLKNSINDNKLSSEVNNVNVCNSIESNTDNNKIADSNNLLMKEKSEKAIDGKKSVFKLLNKLSYKENEMGCSVAEGWSINNFKCGIFKLRVNAQMSCKTLHSNSNLGGVLIKGNLRMKIGNRDLNLTEGDMVYVPPLTEWLATNIGKCETLFYYWCGRFDV